MKKSVAGKLKAIKLVILDVDGVLTDGGIIYNDLGQETKVFDVRDGHGIKLLMRAGMDVAIITARQSKVVEVRAENLGIKLVLQGMKQKSKALDEVMEKTGLKADELAYMGDDLIDLPVLKRVGFSACPADAVEEVREAVDYVAKRPGGKGAVREFCELILKSQGRWDEVLAYYSA